MNVKSSQRMEDPGGRQIFLTGSKLQTEQGGQSFVCVFFVGEAFQMLCCSNIISKHAHLCVFCCACLGREWGGGQGCCVFDVVQGIVHFSKRLFQIMFRC